MNELTTALGNLAKQVDASASYLNGITTDIKAVEDAVKALPLLLERDGDTYLAIGDDHTIGVKLFRDSIRLVWQPSSDNCRPLLEAPIRIRLQAHPYLVEYVKLLTDLHADILGTHTKKAEHL